MPVVRKSLEPLSPDHSRLVDLIRRELRAASESGSSTDPYVIEEEQRGGYIHVTVLWDMWENVPADGRGQVIMDAYEAERTGDVQKITLAMGLTHGEAEKLGVSL
jgi:hypothetical protein